MSELTDKAIADITGQAMKQQGDYMYTILEEYLTGICTTDAVAGKLLAGGKTLEGFIGALWDKARASQKKGVAAMSSAEVIPMLEEYYGIVEADKQGKPDSVIDIMDILTGM